MSSSANIWMPFYIGDYHRETSRLTTEQHGAYLLFIMDYWVGGPLPDDDTVLATISRLSVSAWSSMRPSLEALFQIRDGHWYHSRIEAERADANARMEQRKVQAKAAIEARWAKQRKGACDTERHTPRNTDGNTPGIHIHSHNHSHNHTQVRETPNGVSPDLLSKSPDQTDPPVPEGEGQEEPVDDEAVTAQDFFEEYNEIALKRGLPVALRLTPERRKKINARIRGLSVPEIAKAFDTLERSKFLAGNNDRGWKADLDFMIQAKSFDRLLDGGYE